VCQVIEDDSGMLAELTISAKDIVTSKQEASQLIGRRGSINSIDFKPE
jgi:hypothetical protein